MFPAQRDPITGRFVKKAEPEPELTLEQLMADAEARTVELIKSRKARQEEWNRQAETSMGLPVLHPHITAIRYPDGIGVSW